MSVYDLLNTPGAIDGGIVIHSNGSIGCSNLSEINTYCGDADADGTNITDGDCDDNDNTIFPGATEVCDGKDNDCNNQVDDGISITYYADTDVDNFGDPNNTTTDGCTPPSGYVSDDTDCDDTDAAIYVGATCDDGDPNTSNDVYDSNCVCVGTQAAISISVQINDNDDDVAERNSNGNMDFSSSDLELINDGGDEQTVGMRFNNIDIPPSATVTSAYIQFTVDETNSGTTNLTFKAEAHDDAPAFSNNDHDVSDRTTTNASVNWNPSDWTSVGEAGTDQQTPDLSAIVQEIVDRAGWSANNSMVFIVTGSGERTAESHDGSPSDAPILHVTYTTGNPCAPNVDADGDGACSDVDCDDNDATVYIGASCDDGDPNTHNDVYDSNCICVGSSSVDVSVQVNASNDDAEERNSNGSVLLNSSDLELVEEGPTPQTVGIRFKDVNIPAGATVTNAYIQFTVDETDSGSTNVTIKGGGHDDAPAFANSTDNISSRSTTGASVTWTPPAWNTVGEAGIDQQTPDISVLVQEIVDRPGWAANNSMTFIMTGTGERTAESYDGSAADAPVLHITYETNSPLVALPLDDGKLKHNKQVAKDLKPIDSPTETIKENSLYVFPNPTNGLLNVRYESAEGRTAFAELFDQTGKKMLFRTVQTLQGKIEFQLRLGHLPAGLYLFRIMEEGEQLTEKIIVR